MSAGCNPYLRAEHVAERLGVTVETIRDYARTGAIPHLKRPGSRRLLFRPDEIEAWEEGAALQAKTLQRGGRRVKPITSKTH